MKFSMLHGITAWSSAWVLAGKDVDNGTEIERHVVLNVQEGQAS